MTTVLSKPYMEAITAVTDWEREHPFGYHHPGFQRTVIVRSEDDLGVIVRPNAFAMRFLHGGRAWFVVFAEHDRTEIFGEEDVTLFQLGPQEKIESLKLLSPTQSP